MKASPYYLRIILLLVFVFLNSIVFSLDLSVNKAAFQYKNTKYLEVYLQVLGSTVTYKDIAGSKKQASVELTILIKNDSQIYNFEKFILNSPENDFAEDFIGIRRFKIENGNYDLVVEARDLNFPENTYYSSIDFSVDFSEKLCISDFQLLAKIKKNSDASNPFVKNGYYMEPTLFSYLPNSIDTLGIYFEIYNAQNLQKGSKVKLNINSGFRSENPKELVAKQLELIPGELVPVLTQLDIKGLSSGNYHLKAEIIDQFGVARYSSSVNFQRSNPVGGNETNMASKSYENSFVHKLNNDSLMYSLKAMIPILNGTQSDALNNIITAKKYSEGKYFLWRYWFEKNAVSPETAYNQYMKYAYAVDKTYRSQVGYGFETDRGYIYLKYGMPTDLVTRESEPTAPPYEIWFYDHIEQGKQKNVRFIFYIPSLAHNDYELLHSTCIGEKNNPKWFYDLYSKRNDSNTVNMQPSQIQEFYNSLRNSFDNNAVKIWEEFK